MIIHIRFSFKYLEGLCIIKLIVIQFAGKYPSNVFVIEDVIAYAALPPYLNSPVGHKVVSDEKYVQNSVWLE